MMNDFHPLDFGDRLPLNPLELFSAWLQHVILQGVVEPTAVTVSTVTPDGWPQSRVVFMRDLVEEGLVFYTNYEGDKGRQLLNNPRVALNFLWASIDRQVRITGLAEVAPAELSDAYFEGRARESQLGAWASPQSREIESRQWLLDEVQRMERKYEGTSVPRPPHWGGFLVRPHRIEFWAGRTSRLHDRLLYLRQDEGQWSTTRLAP